MSYRLGIDVGGTFTDFLLLDERGGMTVHKELSTPADPSEAVEAGIAALAAARGAAFERFMPQVDLIVHGTTVTTNAVLTGRHARTGLLTTRGFRDALQMRRGVREEMYDNRFHPPPPIVPRHLRLPVTERLDCRGEEVTPLALADVAAAIEAFREARTEAVAVCFMHAHANGAHERAAAQLLAAALPGVYVCASAEVLPQVRFYERTSTTVLNASVGPILVRYLDGLTRRLAAARFRGVLLVMQSNGGVARPADLYARPAMTLLSGPAAAPAAGLACTGPHGSDFITMDMGGTSFDAALVRGGEPAITTAASVNRYALALPSMEINTIGAGGGSIAWIDDGGLLHMGPQSAGAAPGPACYGRGGREPTCSDANLLLGYLSAEFFAGGRIRLDRGAAERAIDERVARPLGLEALAAAAGMFALINVNMAAAIREISVNKGYDPREFPLICAGGAGPIHGVRIAEELGIRRVVVPRDASIFCAAGMLRTDLKHDLVRSHARLLDGSPGTRAAVRAVFRAMEREARARLVEAGIPAPRRRMQYAMDLRYLGQYHELTLELPAEVLEARGWDRLRGLFDDRHDRLYGYALRSGDTPLELLNLRVTGIGLTEKAPLAREARARPDPRAALKGRRGIWLPGRTGLRPVPVYDGDRLRHGHRLEGPALVETTNTTILVPPVWTARYDLHGSCVIGADASARRGAA